LLKRVRPTCTERKSLKKSPDGRMATEAARLKRKNLQQGGKRKTDLDTHRPSHGRRLGSNEKTSNREEKEKPTLTLTGLLMEGGSAQTKKPPTGRKKKNRP